MVIAASLLAGGGLALASPPGGYGYDHDKQDKHDKYDKHDKHGDDGDYGHHDNGKHKGWYKKGDHLPDHYYGHDYEVDDYERYHLRRPDPGYRWVRGDGGAFYLTLISSGVVIDVSAGF